MAKVNAIPTYTKDNILQAFRNSQPQYIQATFNQDAFRAEEVTLTHTLPSTPEHDQPVMYEGQKYGRPHFRLKPQDANQSGGIWFVEEEDKLKLRFILQAFRPEEDVIPLDFRSIQINLTYYHAGSQQELSMDVQPEDIRQVYIDRMNILKDIHASLVIPPENKEAIYEALTNLKYRSELSVRADVWWQEPKQNNVEPKVSWLNPTPPLNGSLPFGRDLVVEVNAVDENSISDVQLWLNNKLIRKIDKPPYRWGATRNSDALMKNLIPGKYTLKATARDTTGKETTITRNFQVADPVGVSYTRFNYKNLSLKGNYILLPNNRVFMQHKSVQDAQTALKLIQHYKMDTHCVLPGYGKYNLEYFLSIGQAPAGSSNLKEDIIKFDPNKLQVVNKQNNWYILEGASHSMLFFGPNKHAAYEALEIIKVYGFTEHGFVGRPNPPMSYWKRQQQYVFNPSVLSNLGTINVITSNANVLSGGLSGGVTMGRSFASRGVDGPKKLDIEFTEVLHFSKNDHDVFRGIFDQLEDEDLKWEKKIIPNPDGGKDFTIHYRKTKDPNVYFFLPQVFRLQMNDEGYPQVKISMWSKGDGGADLSQYKIAVECSVLPYIHPNAKKDMLEKLYQTEGKKYAELAIGGYSTSRFLVDGAFRSIFEELGGKAIFVDGQELPLAGKGQEIDLLGGIEVDASGFNLSFITTLESFEDLRRRFEEGHIIGKIQYELEEELEEGGITTGSYQIEVELNLKKLANVSPDVAIMLKEVTGEGSNGSLYLPEGIELKHTLPYPLTIKGVDLTLLSKVGGEVYDVDYQIYLKDENFPKNIANDGSKLSLLLNEEDISDTRDNGLFWTDLICRPHGLYYDVDARAIMTKIIDYAHKEEVPWSLNVEFIGNWEQVQKIQVVIADLNGKLIQAVDLDEDETEIKVQMATSLSAYLNTADGFNREYKYKRRFFYRDGTDYIDPDWQESSVFDTTSLFIRPYTPV
ncbi:MAG: hypothetical protein R2824_01835 [Saprospiraceae bacterium]|nr:hypothetical protein [Lewinella sp.]